MIKTIKKVGNTCGLIFDSSLSALTDLKAGDRVYVTVHEQGVIVITPLRQGVGPREARANA